MEGHPKHRYAGTRMSKSTCGDSGAPIDWGGTLGAEIAAMEMEYLAVTCDTDMLTVPYHRSFDDTAIVDADVAHICAVDAVAASRGDWLISLPLN